MNFPKTKTPQNLINLIDDFVDKQSDLMSNLYCRWLDESQYEDIADYSVPLIDKFPKEFIFDKMSKRPFGIVFHIENVGQYHFFSKSNCIGWKRIA